MSRQSYQTSSRRLRLERLENRSLLAGGLLAVGLTDFAGASEALQQQDLTNVNVNNEVQQPAARLQEPANQLPESVRPPADNAVASTRQTLPATPIVSSADFVLTTDSVSSADTVQSSLSSNTDETTTASGAALVSATDATFASFADRGLSEAIAASASEPEDTLDLSPLLRSSWLRSDTLRAESWQLDHGTIPRLRQMLEAQPDESAQIADAVVDEWYGAADGMLGLDRVQLPAANFALDSVPVNVQLESTLLLYRSLELFNGTASPHIALPAASPVSEPVLDAIMATLSELAESETQPVDNPLPNRQPTLAYPLAAIAATGAAIAVRQRARTKQLPNTHKGQATM